MDGGWDHIRQACQRDGINEGIDFSSSVQGIRTFLVSLGRIGARWVWEERPKPLGGEGGGGEPEREGEGEGGSEEKMKGKKKEKGGGEEQRQT